jgi:hypothetical protein
MNHGKVRYAHKEHLIESNAKIIDCVYPERVDILDKHGDDPVQDIKVTQDAVDNLHDKCSVTPVKTLSKLIKGMFRFTLLFQDIVKARNGRNPRFCHAVAGCDRAEVNGSPVKKQVKSKRWCKRIVIVFILSMELSMKNLLHDDMPAVKIQ